MNALLLDNPVEVCRLTAADPAAITFHAITPFLGELGSAIHAGPMGSIDWSPAVSTMAPGRLAVRYAEISWSCVVDAVPADIGPTGAVSLRIRAALPGDGQSPDVCTPANFTFMWTWARPILRDACTRAARALPDTLSVVCSTPPPAIPGNTTPEAR